MDCACVPLKFYLKNSRRTFLHVFSVSEPHTFALLTAWPSRPEARSSTPFALIGSRLGSRESGLTRSPVAILVVCRVMQRARCSAPERFVLRSEAMRFEITECRPQCRIQSDPIPSRAVSYFFALLCCALRKWLCSRSPVGHLRARVFSLVTLTMN